MIVLGTIVPFICMIGALRYIPATRATVTAMLEPVLAGIVAYAWLGEEIGSVQINRRAARARRHFPYANCANLYVLYRIRTKS